MTRSTIILGILAVAAPAAADEVITITGSTAEHELRTGAAPVTVVTRAELLASGRTTLGEILQSLPVQSNASNAQVNAGGDGATRINLRGLGAARTLVLLNGRRFVNGGAGANTSADIDAIPLAVVERVEIFKAGASALYGAEAVAGVVNIVTRTHYDGAEVSLLAGTSQHGDGTDYEINGVAGAMSSDRHTGAVISIGYQDHAPVLASDRAFSRYQKLYDFASRREQRLFSSATPRGRLDLTAVGPGQTAARPPGCTSDLCRSDGGDGWTDFVEPDDRYNDTAGNYLYTPAQRINIFASAHHRIDDHTEAIVEFLYQRRNSTRQLSSVAFSADKPISKDSLYNPFGADLFDYRRRLTELGERQFLELDRTVRFVVGVQGRMPAHLPLAGWNYEMSFNLSTSRTIASTTGQLYLPRVADALGPSMLNAQGEPICVRVPGDASTQINYVQHEANTTSRTTPCVPLNLFAAPGSIPRAQLDGLTYQDSGYGRNGLRVIHGSGGGTITTLPHHGSVALALGGDIRLEVGEQRPPSVASSGDATDLVAKATDAQFDTFEAYGELTTIPYADGELVRRVELDLGGRALRHSELGGSATWKAAALVRTTGGLALRGTYATAFRAPTLRDTIGGIVEREVNLEDPCDTAPPSAGVDGRVLAPDVQARCTQQLVPIGSRFNTSQQRAATSGNPDLVPERAVSATAGVIYEPSVLDGVTLSADIWDIAISRAIDALPAQTIVASCFERGLDEFCAQIHRDPKTHRIAPIDQTLHNLRRTVTSGVDVSLHHDAQLGALGRLRTALDGQYLLRYDLATSGATIHGAGNYDLGVYPRLRANLAASWSHGSGASAGANLRFVGSYDECAGDVCSDASHARRAVAAYTTLDVYAGYDFDWRYGHAALQLGVTNALDATPPAVYNASAANSDATTYDFIGRAAYLRLTERY